MHKALCVAALLLAGCSAPLASDPTTNQGSKSWEFKATPPDAAATQAGNEFAWELHRQLGRDSGNLFFSPQSIREAFGMLLEGAKGTTAAEIASALNLPADADARHTLLGNTRAWLARPGSGVELAQANAAWVQDGFALQPAFRDAIVNAYGGRVEDADFIGAAERERAAINAWVEDVTRNRIKDLFPQGAIDSDSRLVLVNAIYFNGTWAQTFNASLTKPSTFNHSAGKVQVPFMHRESTYAYAQRDGVQALRIPYSRDNVSMLILLPEVGKLAVLEASLNDESMRTWRGALASQKVEVALPKFTFKTDYPNMRQTMEALGIRAAFTDAADLSGIAGKPGDLLVSAVVHKAFVAVDERGTEAAAATGIVVGVTSVPAAPPKFTADRPFVFLIQDDATGLVLFMGRVANPA